LNFFQLLGSLELPRSYDIVITDINGKLLLKTKAINQTEQINFSNYAVGTYFITVSQNNQLVKTFKSILSKKHGNTLCYFKQE